MSADFAERYTTSHDGLKLSYRDYPPVGDAFGLPVLCVHGLTRNSKDFEVVAPRLAKLGRRVLSVDVRGRGKSDRDPNPENYNPMTYVQDVATVLEDAGVDQVVWLGTSMGGIMAMIAASAAPDALGAVILNDIGPELQTEGIERIKGYVGGDKAFTDWDEAAEAVRAVNGEAFPNEADNPDFWMAFARRTCQRGADGMVHLDYDRAIAAAVKAGEAAPPAMWNLFEGLLDIPTLLIRGAITDLLSPSTVEGMVARKPDLKTVNVAGVGHAPMLDEPEAWDAILSFLSEVP